MTDILDTNGTPLHVGDMVTGPEGCGHSFKITEVHPGNLGLIKIRAHGLTLCDHIVPGLNDLVEGAWMTRWADAATPVRHRDGLVTFAG